MQLHIVEQLETIQDFIRWGASRFNEAGLVFGHGTDNALDESAALLLHTLHLPTDLPPVFLSSQLTDSEKQAVLDIIKRRIEERLPVPYLTHEAWFAGMAFYVDQRVLIPRSPIAELIENGFEPWLAVDHVERVLDMCTGSGCIAIACALAFPDAQVDAVDISPDALDVARINIERYHLNEHVHPIESDLFSNLGDRKYQFIVTNPPYVGAAEMAGLPREYQHEPSLGLEAEDAGLEVALRIIREAPNYLVPGGLLVIEVGNSAAALVERYPDFPFIWPEFQRGGHGIFVMPHDLVLEFVRRFGE
jgi:ribosomal protein L3 glutamine methyltransferase